MTNVVYMILIVVMSVVASFLSKWLNVPSDEIYMRFIFACVLYLITDKVTKGSD